MSIASQLDLPVSQKHTWAIGCFRSGGRKSLLYGALLGFLLSACGGSDFEAASTVNGRSVSNDSDPPTEDAGAPVDSGASVPDAQVGEESHGDDGVPTSDGPADATFDGATDAITESVVDAAPDSTAPAPDGSFDAATDRLADAHADATCDASNAFYHDRDGDGFGSTSERIMACVAPAADDAGAWVIQPGDCRDDLVQVKPYDAGSPDPPNYAGVGYPDPVRPQAISFDYDCNGDETGDPSNMFGVAPTCPALVTNCNGTGYMPALPARNGTGINPLCGSTTLRSCVVQGLNCREQLIQMATPFRCR